MSSQPREKDKERELKTIQVKGDIIGEDDRKIIQVGNSEGFTLGPSWRQFLFGVGRTLGRKIHLEFVVGYDGCVRLVVTPLEEGGGNKI